MHRKPNFEQSQDFFKAIKRLIKELNSFKVIIIFSLLLAATSSILSIASPSKLSNLTDEIQHGLVVKKDNMTYNINNEILNIKNNITKNYPEEQEFKEYEEEFEKEKENEFNDNDSNTSGNKSKRENKAI